MSTKTVVQSYLCNVMTAERTQWSTKKSISSSNTTSTTTSEMNNKHTKVQINLYAAKLRNVAGLGKGKSDPYAVVTLLAGDSSERPRVLGKTEVIKNSLSPVWTTSFVTTYTFGKVPMSLFPFSCSAPDFLFVLCLSLIAH